MTSSAQLGWNPGALVGIALIGLCIGSFLNVVAYRVPLGRSVVHPASACPQCQHRLSWWENLPVLSWLTLQGKCRSCRQPISVQYPLVEVIAALVAVTVAVLIGPQPVLFAWLVGAGFCLPLAIIDVHTQRLPVVIMYPAILATGVALVITAVFTGQWGNLMRAAGGGLGLSAAFFALWWITGGKGMGRGDVRLAWLLGSLLGWLGWEQLILGGWLGFASGALLGLVLICTGSGHQKSPIPFGPHMMLGALAGLIWGPTLAGLILP